MRTCPCGFEAEKNIPPTSPLWHRQHRAHHIERYPSVDQGTKDALEQLIYSAEHASLAALVQGHTALDAAAMHSRMGILIKVAEDTCEHDPATITTALVGAIGAHAVSTSIADKLLELAIAALSNARSQLLAQLRTPDAKAVLS